MDVESCSEQNQKSFLVRGINAMLGVRASMPELRRRRISFLFLFCILATSVLPILVTFPDAMAQYFDVSAWWTMIFGGVVACLVGLRIFKREKLTGSLFCLWLVGAIGAYPAIHGDVQHLPLLTLVLIPVVMGLIAGASTSALGAASVLAVYISAAVRSYGIEGGDALQQMALIIYAGPVTLLACFVFVYFDNSNQIQANALGEDNVRIKKEALTDSLTGCGNRRDFQQTIDAMITRAETGARHGLIIIDMDRFKQINDTFGHDVGDQVLQTFADRLKTIAGDQYQAFRLGGDEFAFICPNVPNEAALQLIGEQIASSTDAPILTATGALEFDVSIGMALSDKSGAKLDRLYQQADAATFVAKEKTGSHFVMFDATLDGATTRKFEVEQCLKAAVHQGAIDVAFQPQVDLRNGSIVAYEALARWNDPLLGKVSPCEFIPIAEQSTLMQVLDRHIIAAALRSAAVWLGRHQRISINVSARSLNSKQFVEFILTQISRCHLKPAQVEIEITETALIENWEKAKLMVETLRTHGVRIVLDDFGVGYSSLSYLVEFPVQKIKFDRSFLERSGDQPTALVMQSITDLTRKMNVELVAEGIETKEQLALLRKIGCFKGQGFLLGKPIARTEILKKSRSTSVAA